MKSAIARVADASFECAPYRAEVSVSPRAATDAPTRELWLNVVETELAEIGVIDIQRTAMPPDDFTYPDAAEAPLNNFVDVRLRGSVRPGCD